MSSTPTVSATITANEDKTFSVWLDWTGVDRPRTYGICCGTKKALATRLAKAVDAQVAFPFRSIETDRDGETFVSHGNNIYVRHLNAELTRIGF